MRTPNVSEEPQTRAQHRRSVRLASLAADAGRYSLKTEQNLSEIELVRTCEMQIADNERLISEMNSPETVKKVTKKEKSC